MRPRAGAGNALRARVLVTRSRFNRPVPFHIRCSTHLSKTPSDSAKNECPRSRGDKDALRLLADPKLECKRAKDPRTTPPPQPARAPKGPRNLAGARQPPEPTSEKPCAPARAPERTTVHD